MKWTSVNNQLPNPLEVVLVWDPQKKPEVQLAKLNDDEMWLGIHPDCDQVDQYFPTHWMPLPKGPK
jgi:hypothetical protein